MTVTLELESTTETSKWSVDLDEDQLEEALRQWARDSLPKTAKDADITVSINTWGQGVEVRISATKTVPR